MSIMLSWSNSTVDFVFLRQKHLTHLLYTNWHGEMCWPIPPVHLVSRVLYPAQACSAKGTLIVPLWKSATFWPKVCPDGRQLAPFVHTWYVFRFKQVYVEAV